MSQIKSRNWTSQEDEDLTAILQEMKESQRESTWNEIAEKMKLKNFSSRKTGKQCRERWANQLDPRIKRTENWTKEENETLFKLHFELGNKWSEICSHIPGRTDNCVKNHFYSTMRRGMRKVNSYIENVKRKTSLAKIFKNEILNKILALCEGKNDDKFQFSTKAKDLAIQIKANLIQLSLELTDVDEEDEKFKEEVFEQISEFSRNCRKRKRKRSTDLLSEAEEDSEEKMENINQASKKEIKLKQNVNNIRQEKEITKMENSSLPLHFISSNEPVKLPLFHISKPSGVSEKLNFHSEVETQTLNNFKAEQASGSLNPFDTFPYSLPWENASNFFGIKETNEKKNESLKSLKSGFINCIPELKKVRTNENKIQSGHIDFTVFPSIKLGSPTKATKEAVNSIFPSIIQSQEFELTHSLRLKDENANHYEGDHNLGMSFTSSFSPFSFCYPHNSFNTTLTLSTQEEKFRSTRYDSNDFEESSPINEKSGFKLIRRPSNNSNKAI